MTYGTEAFIPVEIMETSRRTEIPLDEEMNDEALRDELDLVEEIRSGAALREAMMKRQVALRHDSKVIKREFQVGSLVLQRKQKDSGKGKLDANWKGPYRIQGATGIRAYYLKQLNGEPLPRP